MNKIITTEDELIRKSCVNMIMRLTDLKPSQQEIIENSVENSSSDILAMMLEIVDKLECSNDDVTGVDFNSYKEWPWLSIRNRELAKKLRAVA